MTRTQEYSFFTLEIDGENFAWVTFDFHGEKVNKLNSPVMKELSSIISDLSTIYSLQTVFFLSGKPGNFIAGADIKEIEGIADSALGIEKATTGQKILNMIEQLETPTIAIIGGACLGGGMELALACTYRVATDNAKTILGQPEVNLGIIPGFGGTQRLPKLVGYQKAIDLILSGRAVGAREGRKMGLVDEVVPTDIAREAALQFAKSQIALNKGKKRKPRYFPRTLRDFLLEGNPFGRGMIFRMATQKTWERTRGNYPAPICALEAIKTSQMVNLERGLATEAKLFGELVATPTCKNLIRLFFLQEALKKDPGVKTPFAHAKPVHKVAVLGAGVMGAGIAELFASQGISVRLKDIDWATLAKGMQSIQSVVREKTRRRKIDRAQSEKIMQRISPTTDFSGFHHAEIIIEAAPEVLDIKKKLLAEADRVSQNGSILATNTSSLSIDAIAEGVANPATMIGMHFFNPVNRMPLVEVVVGRKTAPETIARVVSLTKQLGKTPVVVQNQAGFLVNRILMPYINEAILLIQEGADIEDVDRVMQDFGMPMGPAELADEVGLDISAHVAKILYEAFGERMKPAVITQSILEAKRFGKKSGRGFYIHTGKNKKADQAGIDKLLRALRASGAVPRPRKIDSVEMVDRMTLVMLNEAARCLEDGVVDNPHYIDAAMVLGAGWAPFRGGPMRYLDTLGISAVVRKLELLTQHAGMRFEPAQRLREYARLDAHFTF